jgi:hypothetical protein
VRPLRQPMCRQPPQQVFRQQARRFDPRGLPPPRLDRPGPIPREFYRPRRKKQFTSADTPVYAVRICVRAHRSALRISVISRDLVAGTLTYSYDDLKSRELSRYFQERTTDVLPKGVKTRYVGASVSQMGAFTGPEADYGKRAVSIRFGKQSSSMLLLRFPANANCRTFLLCLQKSCLASWLAHRATLGGLKLLPVGE